VPVMVRVFCCDVSAVTEREYNALWELASPRRRQRADGYPKRSDAVRCLAAEALLRCAFPGLDPEAIQKDPGGKPRLEGAHFNLSHSGQWVALAVGDSPVGVDVECLREGRPIERLARRYFTEEECRRAGDSQEGFLRIWTAKESRLKYLGVGLREALDSFSVLEAEDIRTWRIPGAVLSLCAQELPETWESVSLERILRKKD